MNLLVCMAGTKVDISYDVMMLLSDIGLHVDLHYVNLLPIEPLEVSNGWDFSELKWVGGH